MPLPPPLPADGTAGESPQGLDRMRVALLLACPASIPVGLLLPAHWGWENSWIENLQVLVLMLGFACAAVFVRRSDKHRNRLFWLGIAPVWLLVAARELSWGAVLAEPLAFTAEGPQFSSNTLWFKPYVYGLAGAVLGICAGLLAAARLDRVVGEMLRHAAFPWAETLVVLLAAMGSSLAEGHLGWDASALGAQAQPLEELLELVGYMALVLAQARVAWSLRSTA
nr:hypothetical protein [Variovorax boronicumulans]